MNRDQIEARIAELEAKNDAATGWGAAVGARCEEIKSLRQRLDADLPTANDVRGILRGSSAESATAALAGLYPLMDSLESFRGEKDVLRISGKVGDPQDVGIAGVENTLRAISDAVKVLEGLRDVAQGSSESATCDDLGAMLHDYDYGADHDADADMIGQYRCLAAAIMRDFDVRKRAPQPPAAPVETKPGVGVCLDCGTVDGDEHTPNCSALLVPPSSAGSIEPTVMNIHRALSDANLEYSGYSCNGVNLFGDRKSVDAASRAFHSHSQLDWYQTNLRHWRDECGKLHAKLDSIRAVPQEAWQPIETAPKDGTKILAATVEGMTTSYWFNGRFSGWMIGSDGPTHWMLEPKLPSALSRPQSGGGQ